MLPFVKHFFKMVCSVRKVWNFTSTKDWNIFGQGWFSGVRNKIRKVISHLVNPQLLNYKTKLTSSNDSLTTIQVN